MTSETSMVVQVLQADNAVKKYRAGDGHLQIQKMPRREQ